MMSPATMTPANMYDMPRRTACRGRRRPRGQAPVPERHADKGRESGQRALPETARPWPAPSERLVASARSRSQRERQRATGTMLPATHKKKQGAACPSSRRRDRTAGSTTGMAAIVATIHASAKPARAASRTRRPPNGWRTPRGQQRERRDRGDLCDTLCFGRAATAGALASRGGASGAPAAARSRRSTGRGGVASVRTFRVLVSVICKGEQGEG